MEIFEGEGVANGIGIGKAFFIPKNEKKRIPRLSITKEKIESEWMRFIKAKAFVSSSISKSLASLTDSEEDKTQKEIFETYILMLEDAIFLNDVRIEIEKTLLNIEWVIKTKAEEYANKLLKVNNKYLIERAKDITDVFALVIDRLMGVKSFEIEAVPEDSVVIAAEISATDAIIFSKKKIAALVMQEGGTSSHVVILARNYEVPTVVHIDYNKIRRLVKDEEEIIVDSAKGKILSSPTENILNDYTKALNNEKMRKTELSSYINKKALTKDKTEITIMANVSSLDETKMALEDGAEGIGLFRTEFMFMNEGKGESMSENEQFKIYKAVLETAGEKPVTIRTLDSGGDKLLNLNEIQNNGNSEKNPLMGLRAIRLTLKYRSLFKTQLRALLRASLYGNLRILLPLITTEKEVMEAKSVIEEAKNELKLKGESYKDDVKIGIMIETPAAALISDKLAREVDFFSVGTNDLTQYTMAVDRENAATFYLFDEFNLSVIRLLKLIVSNANRAGIPCSVCGEMAGKEEGTLIIIGLGVRTLSMSSKLISSAKKLLKDFTLPELEEKAKRKLEEI